MLEILLLYALGKNIAEKAENQGKGGTLFVIILIVLWFLGEITGGVIGFVVTGEPLYAVMYAYIGAAAGAVLAYTFLAVLPLMESAMQERPQPRRRRRRRYPRRADEDREDDDRRERRRRKSEDDEVYEDLEVMEEEEEKPRQQQGASTDFEIVADDEPRPRRRPGGEIRPDKGPRPTPPPRRRPRGED
jgi:hypothetical protein